MKVFVKILVGIITIIPILIVAAVLIVPRVVDPNDYRERISKLVREQTNRDFGIEGDLSLSVFPWVGVTAHDIWLAQPAALEGDNMVEIGEVDLRVKLLPLINRQVEVDTIVLVDPTVRIMLLEDGRSSFDGLGKTGTDDQAESGAGDAAGAAAAIAVQGLELESGTFVWEDRAAGQTYELRDLSVATGQLLTGMPEPLSIAGQLLDSSSPDTLQFEVEALVALDIKNYIVGVTDIQANISRGDLSATSQIQTLRYEHASSQLDLNGVTADAKLGEQPVQLAAPELSLNLDTQALQLPGFRMTMTPTVLSGSVTASEVFDAPVIAGDVVWEDQESGQRYQVNDLRLSPGQVLNGETDRVTASGVLTDSATPDPTRFDMTGMVSLDEETSDVTVNNADVTIARGEMRVASQVEALQYEQATSQLNLNGLSATTEFDQRPLAIRADTITANLETQELEIPDLKLEISPAVLAASVSATQIFDNPSASGQLRADEFSLAELLRNSEIEYTPADPDAMSAMSISTVYSATPSSFELNGLLGLDESALAGSFNLDNFDAPVIRFDLSLNEINIDRYLPATTDEEAASRQQVQASAALVLPVALFRELNANGSFNADSLISGGMRVSNIDVQVVSDNGSVTVTPTAELYGGTMDGTLSYQNLGGREELVIRETIDNVRLGDFLADTGVTNRVTGTGGLNIDLTVAEEHGDQSSRGQIDFAARDGELRGVDIQKLVQQATALYYQARGRTLDPEREQPGEGTQFSELTGTFVINNMVLVNDDLVMKAPAFRVNGKGKIDLNRGELNYLASAAIVKSAEGQGGAERSDLRAIPIPVRCSGNISDPSCGLDVAELTKEIAKQEIVRKRGELEEKILEEVGEEINLEGLFDLLKK